MPTQHLESVAFDREAANQTFLAAAAKKTMVHQKLAGNVAWPTGLDPRVRPTFGSFTHGVNITTKVNVPTDVLILLYTNQETQALLDVFTGNDTWDATVKNKWYPYANNFNTLSTEIGGMNKNTLLKNGIFGHFFPMQIGNKQVVLYKTELHPKNDGNKVPFIPVIKQIVSELAPKLVITTGTAGAVGATLKCGDVVITDTTGLHCRDTYATIPDLNNFTNNDTAIKSKGAVTVDKTRMDYVRNNYLKLSIPGLDTCLSKFAGDSTYSFVKKNDPPTIYVKGQNDLPGQQPMSTVSADYITVSDNFNVEGLNGLGSMNDTDDGFAAYAISLLPTAQQPQWLSIRNASEPEMVTATKTPGTLGQAVHTLENLAGPIYQVYQYCTTINSAFACWGVIAGMP
jgi:hypothetical protein